MDELDRRHPAKRMRLSLGNETQSDKRNYHKMEGHTLVPAKDISADKSWDDRMTLDAETISISSSSKQASQAIAPFLSRHIPDQYAPHGHSDKPAPDPGTKYCYRHRPDLNCRGPADEPSMDQLQRELEVLSQTDQQGIAHVWALFSAAPAKHRQLMLQGILAQCCFPQLSFLSRNVRELVRIDFLSALPNELGFQILSYLDTISLCKAAQVSRKWREMADDDQVWLRMCEQHIDRKCTKCGWGLPSMERERLRASKRQNQLRATGRGLNMWSPKLTPEIDSVPTPAASTQIGTSVEIQSSMSTSNQPTPSWHARAYDDSYFQPPKRPWKDVYKDRFKIGSNWKHGRYTTKVFKGHRDGVMCLQFNDQILATGSYDTTIKIWDIETGKEIRTFIGHGSVIRCLQFDDTKLISGSRDSKVKIWNWRTGQCLRTLSGHSDGVISLHFASTILATGSMDNTIHVWNFEEKTNFVLKGHTDWVNSVKIDLPSRTLFSASDDLTIRLWDLDTQSTLKTFTGHVGQVQQLVLLPQDFELEDELAPDPNDSTDDTTSPNSPETIVSTCPGFEYPEISCMSAPPILPKRPLPPQYFLTSGLDSTIRLWSTRADKSLRTFFGHVEGVWALAADTLRVVSGAEDRMVKVWDARTGRCERTFTGHAGPVTCIGLSDSRIFTGSEDHQVRMLGFGCDEAEA